MARGGEDVQRPQHTRTALSSDWRLTRREEDCGGCQLTPRMLRLLGCLQPRPYPPVLWLDRPAGWIIANGGGRRFD
eukprot:scaffold7422_cov277-Pinguiococcus_pyrenoidosus.AAC.2